MMPVQQRMHWCSERLLYLWLGVSLHWQSWGHGELWVTPCFPSSLTSPIPPLLLQPVQTRSCSEPWSRAAAVSLAEILCPWASADDRFYQMEHLRAGRLSPRQGLGFLEARWWLGSLSFHFIIELHWTSATLKPPDWVCLMDQWVSRNRAQQHPNCFQ